MRKNLKSSNAIRMHLMRLASYEDFNNGPIYTEYRHHEGYAKRAKLFEPFPDPILVVGCGFGFLVEEFLRLGKCAWGIDASDYCIENRTNENVWQASILDYTDVPLLLAQLGAFETVITEDLLPYLSDDEALIASRHCDLLGHFVIHMVTEQGTVDLNYHSTGYWQALTGQLTISLEGM